MAWVDPTSRSAGDVVTSAIWNQDVVNNPQFLHDRYDTIFVFPVGTGTISNLNDHPNLLQTTGTSSYMEFAIPDDFEALVSVEVLVAHGTTGTLQYDLSVSIFNPDALEAPNQHSATAVNATTSVTANVPKYVSALSLFTSVAAGDQCGLSIVNDGVGGAGQLRCFGVKVIYSRL